MLNYRCFASHPLRRSALAAAVGAMSLALFAPAAQADILIFGTPGFIQPEENVLLPQGQNAEIITGITNQTNASVTFTQPSLPEALVTPGAGQARIAAEDGVGFTSLRTRLTTEGATFTLFEANPVFTGAGFTFTVGVQEDNGQVTSQNFVSGAGQSYFGVQAILGQRISFVDITGPASSIQDVRQIRIGGVQGPGINPIPEPSEWLAMSMAAASVGGLMVRARRRKSIAA